MFAASSDGTIAYIPAAPAGTGEAALMWVDRGGKEKVITTLERVSDFPRLSPDATRVAFRAPGPNCDIWVYDLQRGTTTRLTRGDADHHGVVWTDDGRSIATARLSDRGADIITLPADGSSSPKVWGQSDSDSAVPSAWSASAKTLLVTERRGPTQNDVLAYLANGGHPNIVLDSPSSEVSPAFSPDGRFIAYGSDESGRLEIYARPYRDGGSRTQISTGGGVEPVWARDGSALFFRNGSDLLMVTTQADAGGAFSVSSHVVLFSMRFPPGSMLLPNFDVAADGQRFLIMRGRQWAEGQVVVILNSPSEWKHLGSGATSSR